MSTRRSRPPRSRKSRNPEALPTEIPVIIPPAARAMDEAAMQPPPDVAGDELAAIEAGWDELLA
jgi:hypothetical protein